MLKNFASPVARQFVHIPFSFHCLLDGIKSKNHKMSVGVLIMFKTMLPTIPRRTQQFVHIVFNSHGLLDGIKSKTVNYVLEC